MAGRLPKGVPAETPFNFLEFYARYPHLRRAEAPIVLPWSRKLGQTIVGACRRLKRGERGGMYRGWKHSREVKSELHSARPIWVKGGLALEGACGDFATAQMEMLIDADLPRGAMSLLVGFVKHRTGESEPHMTLAIETSLGTAICCVVAGCKHYGHPWFANQVYTYREGHPGFYQLPLTLADHIERLRA